LTAPALATSSPALAAGLSVSGRHPDDPACCICVEGRLCAHHALHVLPQLKAPSWHKDAKSGNAPESNESADNVRSRQRHERKQRVRRMMRLQTATTGARVGRNSRAA
jgi:hypothetical protein